MSKKMTPCEKLGYKVGDEFEVVEKSYKFDAGDVVCLQNDDGTAYPYFTNEIVKDEYPLGVACFLYSVRKVAKLKPAKQALADAIHQRGGWGVERFMYATSNYVGMVKMFVNKPKLENANWNADGAQIGFAWLSRPLPSWHQCILSRDEYFTAYPEKVNVEIKNETEQKVEVEMKSESEMTIKAGVDWHKNGELPPVGEVCEMKHKHSTADWARPGFEPVVIVASGKDLFIVSGTDVYRETVGSWDEYEFRPLRTERENAIDEMVSLVEPLATYREFAGAIYDAGMYKEVK